MRHYACFNGIGGFQLAAEQVGWENVGSCEIDEWCNKVTKYYYPNCKQDKDVRKTDFTFYRGCVDVFTAGFPCQPFSAAGKRRGKDDDRFLFPETIRAIRECQPGVVVLENVAGLISILEPASLTQLESEAIQFYNREQLLFKIKHKKRTKIEVQLKIIQERVIAQVIKEIEDAGYLLPRTAEGVPIVLCIPACAVNAPHRRDRVWFVAYRNGNGLYGCENRQSMGEGNDSNAPRKDEAGKSKRHPNESAKPTTHPDSNGQRRINREDEKHTGKRGEHAQCDIEQGGEYGVVANPENIRHKQREDYNRGNAGELYQDKSGWDKENGGEPIGCRRASANTNGFRLRYESDRAGKPGFFDKEGEKYNWQDFPTQSPVCDGDDGLSSRLVSITFPKWRNESIKGGGNAIVWQVAYEIFKAIQSTIKQ